MVQLDNEPVPYYRDVIRSGGFAKVMLEMRREQYGEMIHKYHLKGKKFIEVGCGAGEFLLVLNEFPVEVYGIEHEAGLVDQARQKGLRVQNGFPETENTIFEGGLFDAFIACNFLEHMPFPNTYLKAISNNLTDDGIGLITVPSWDYIADRGSCFDLIRDHIAYYTFDTLSLLLQNNGFELLEKKQPDSWTLQIIVRKRKRIKVSNMLKTYDKISGELEAYLDRLQEGGKEIAIWGASHQSFTFAATTCLGRFVKYIIDSAVFKQEKFAPVTYIPIVAPEYYLKHRVDCILIIALGYTNEIAISIREKFGDSVEILALREERYEIETLRSKKGDELIWERLDI